MWLGEGDVYMVGCVCVGKMGPVVEEFSKLESGWEELRMPWVTCKGIKTLSCVGVKPKNFK